MSRHFKKLAAMVCLICLCFSMTSIAYAGDGKETIEQWVNSNGTVSGGELTFKSSNSMASYFHPIGDDVDVSKGNIVTITVSNNEFFYYESDEASIVSKINKLDNVDVSDQIQDITDGLGIGADTKSGVIALSGLSGAISAVLGIITVLVLLGMALFTSADVLYLAFPVFQDKCNEVAQSGNKVMTTTDKKTGDSKMRFVTTDAIKAAEISTTEGRNPFGVYLKRRVWTYVALAVVVYIMMTGNVNIIVNLALKGVEGVLKLIADFG